LLIELNNKNKLTYKKGGPMKKKIVFLVSGLLVFSLTTFNAWSQDMKNMNSKMNEVLSDTTFLRATVVTLEPGQKTDLHSHPAYFAYALSEGKMTVHYKDGSNETVELKPGMGMASGPEKPHVTENTGTTTVKFLIVELKEHPYKAPPMKK
jgi:mannose-6-phosphate isomerase-like protein (cupin superfamily)